VRSVAQPVGSDKFDKPWKRETLAGSVQSRVGIDVLANRGLESLQRCDARRRNGDPG